MEQLTNTHYIQVREHIKDVKPLNNKLDKNQWYATQKHLECTKSTWPIRNSNYLTMHMAKIFDVIN